MHTEASGLLGFAQMLEDLASPAAPDAFFRLLDTVFFLPAEHAGDGRPTVRWYYTTKTGAVAQKRQEHVSIRKIVDRFAKFALANPHNTAGIVGRLVAADDNHMLLNKHQLETHLSGLWHGNLLTEPVAVQVYLRPQNGKDVFVECCSGRGSAGERDSTVWYTGMAAEEPVPSPAKQQAVQVTDQLYAALAGQQSQIRTRFIVDDNGQAWIAGLFLEPAPATTAPQTVEVVVPAGTPPGRDSSARQSNQRPSTNPSSSSHPLKSSTKVSTRAVNSAGASKSRTKSNNKTPVVGWPATDIVESPNANAAVEEPTVGEDSKSESVNEAQADGSHSTDQSSTTGQRNGKLQPDKTLQRHASPYATDVRGASTKKSRRKGHDPGPNMQLLAQFAAEKQRAMEMMAATTQLRSPTRRKESSTAPSSLDSLEQTAATRLQATENATAKQLDRSASFTAHEEAFMNRLAPSSSMPELREAPALANGTDVSETRNLQLQVELLGAQVQLLEQKLADAHADLAAADDKARDAVRQLAAAKSDHERRMSQMQAEHQAALLEVQEAASRKMADLLSSTPQRSPIKGKATVSLSEQAETAEAQATAQYQRLREQLQHAQQELAIGQQQWARERKALFSEFNSKLAAQEEKLRAELSGTRSSIATLEDVLAAKGDQIADLKQQLAMAARREADLARRAEVSEQDATKLQADLKAMQQSLAASTRIELSRGINVDDPKAAIRAVEAKSEAKVRQLNNKLEFLKAQIATEQNAREELEKALDTSRRKVDEVRDEHRARLQEMEQRSQDAIQEVEDNLRRQYEERMMELTSMQTKMATMQNQMQEALQDSAAAKHKEESVRATANRLEVQLMAARRDIEQYRKENDEMRQTLQEYDQRQASQASTDATIRRLDNERQYLRSQLTSEITHKAEIQESLLATQQQLMETKTQWEHDVHTLREQARICAREHENALAKLVKEKNDLEAASSRYERQATELREGYTKLRDQLRGREDDIDSLTIQYRRLQEELTASKEELVRQQGVNEQDKVQAQETVATVQASMDELLEQKRKEVKELQAQLAAQFAMVSSLQRDMLAQHHAQQSEKRAWNRQHGAMRMVTVMQQCLTRNMVRRLGKWKMFTTQTVLKELLQGVMKTELSEAHEQAHKRQQAAVKQCAAQMTKEHRQAMMATTQAHDEKMAQLQATWTRDKEQALQAQHEEFVRLAAEQDEIWQGTAASMRQQSNELQAMTLEEERQRQLLVAQRAQVKLQQAELKFSEELSAMQQNLQASEKEIEALHADIALLRTQHQEAQEKLQTEHDSTVELLRAELDARQEAALVAQLEQLTRQQAEALHEAELAKAAAVDAQRAAGLVELAEALEDAKNNHEEHMRAVRAEFAERESMLAAEHEHRANKLLDAKEQELEHQHRQALETMREAAFAERAQAVAVEGAKWKRTLKEADARFQAESKQSYERGSADATARMQLQLQQAMSQSAEELARQKTMWEQERAEMTKDHKQQIARLVTEKEAERLEAVRQAESALLVKLQASHETKMSQLVDELERKHRADVHAIEAAERAKQQHLQAQWQLEKQTMEDLQRDLKQQLANESANHRDALQELQTALRAQRAEHEQAEQDLLSAHSRALETQQAELEELKAVEMDELARKHFEKQREALEQQERELQEKHQRHMSEIQLEHAEAMEKLVRVVSEAKEHSANLEDQLKATTQALHDTENNVLQLERELSSCHKEHSITIWRLLATGNSTVKTLQQSLIATQKQSVAALDELQHECADRLQEAKATTAKLAAVLQQTADLQKQMKNVLLNHKADILLERKQQIQELEGEVQQIIDERGELLDSKASIEAETEKFETQVSALEDEIRDHSKFSSVQNGRVNVAHARKKRRLDEDLERLLELIEHKRAEIANIDAKLAELSDRQDEREAESVRMEQELVQVLIEQQKLLLGLLAEGKDVADQGSHLVRSASAMSISKS